MMYQTIWSGSNITILYNPRRDWNTCIEYHDRKRFFHSLRDCVTWAANTGLIRDPSRVIKEAEPEALYLDHVDDMIFDDADEHYRLNREIAQSGNVSEIARLIRRFRNRWLL